MSTPIGIPLEQRIITRANKPPRQMRQNMGGWRPHHGLGSGGPRWGLYATGVCDEPWFLWAR
jgi:hypothetical protein